MCTESNVVIVGQYIYIGQTGRSLQQRFDEHLDSYEKNDERSAVARHLLENHYDPAKISIRLIHREKKGAHLNKLEEYEVVKASNETPVTLLNNIQFIAFDSFLQYLFNDSSVHAQAR